MTVVWEHSRADSTGVLVLLAIADHAHDDGSKAWPSVGTLAKKTRLSPRSVRRQLLKLVSLGELEILKGGQGVGNSNCYCVKLLRMTNCHPKDDKYDRDVDKTGTSRVTNTTAKGDTQSPNPSYNRQYNRQEPKEGGNFSPNGKTREQELRSEIWKIREALKATAAEIEQLKGLMAGTSRDTRLQTRYDYRKALGEELEPLLAEAGRLRKQSNGTGAA